MALDTTHPMHNARVSVHFSENAWLGEHDPRFRQGVWVETGTLRVAPVGPIGAQSPGWVLDVDPPKGGTRVLNLKGRVAEVYDLTGGVVYLDQSVMIAAEGD